MSYTSRKFNKAVLSLHQMPALGSRPHPYKFGTLASVIGLTVLTSATPGLAQGGSLSRLTGLGSSDSQAPGLSRRTELDTSLSRFTEAMSDVRTDSRIQELLDQPKVHSLSVAQRVTSPDLETTKFQHFYKGLEVVGSMAYHQHSRHGNTVVDHIAHFDLDTRPTLTEEQSVAIAKSLTGDRPLNGKPELKILPNEQDKGNARLVYWIKLKAQGLDGARDVIVDAHSGGVIGNISRDLQVAPIQIFSAKDQGIQITREVEDQDSDHPTLVGCKLTDLAGGNSQEISPRQCQAVAHGNLPDAKCQLVFGSSPLQVSPDECQPGSSDDSVATTARKNAETVLTYYEQHHHRNSYDGNGSTVVSVVHGGVNYSNAFWSQDQNIMVYGDGDPSKGYGSFANALDVAGHEMTHGVTAATAQLLNMSQNGSLNEANSDFFGIMIAGHTDWTIGKAIWKDPSQAKGIRNLANPAALTYPAPGDDGNPVKKPYPATLQQLVPDEDTCGDTNDNCWIHVNATITGHALYLITQAIGPDKAEHLQYVALTQALGPGDTIQSAAESTKHICDQIYDGSTCDAVRHAYAQVGL